MKIGSERSDLSQNSLEREQGGVMLESVQGTLNAPSSGTYRVRASEVARHRALSCIRVQVLFLDESTQVFELEKRAKGQVLLDLVYNQLELVEKDYFGLQYSDPIGSHDYPWRWLDPLKTVKKQLRIRTKTIGSLGLPVLHFRVKFWVSDPGKLTDEFTRYQMVSQLKKDVVQGRLLTPPSTAALLASYVLQAELGDYNPLEHGTHYLSEIQVVPNQTLELVRKIIELHKLHKGQSPCDAEFNYLDHAKRLDLYGVDVHRAKDSTNRDLDIGVTSSGLVVLQNGIKINTFSWAKIMKVSFKRKQFFIQLRREVNGQSLSSNDKENNNNNTFLQALKRRLYRKSENYDSVLGFNLISYRACKALWKSCVEHHTFFRLHTPRPPSKKAVLTIGSKFRYSGRTEYQTVEECKKRSMMERSFVRSPSKQFVTQSVPSLGESVGVILKPLSTSGTLLRPRSDSSGYKVTSLTGAKMPKMAWIDKEEEHVNGESNGVHEEKDMLIPTTFPATSSASSSESSASSTSALDGTISQLFYMQGSASDESSQGLVSIRIKPDEQGKYGFNVKGGADQQQPVLVSKVAPGTPADRCYPRLNEGDQVLFINGADVATMTHFEVVNAIRNSHETHSNGLLLTVKQNVYEPEGLEEPAFQYVPESLPEGIISRGGLSGRGGALDESMLLLSEALESGSLVAQFEQLYRRKPGLMMNEARRQENEKKNRYRDISPYDATRVGLKTSPSGDYINASYVNMEIPGSGIINRYIACQGPLSTTTSDFWHMVWEQQSTLVVMLTTVVEQGRIKCHRYWPKTFESVEYGPMKIICNKEHETPGFAFREFTITNTQTEEDRHVTHMQYLAWPDHGVPDDSIDFLNFVTKVREARSGMVEPTIVHCSAGIGRTGVLILMETAQCLIEANEPIYPLDIVKEMRDQRAMMIQTASQYRFVCEAIQRVYNECIIQPLAEYQQR